jgi:hypothetical protein
MARKLKNLYRGIAWVFLTVVASGSLAGCNGPASTKYGPPPANSSSYEQNKLKNAPKEIKL